MVQRLYCTGEDFYISGVPGWGISCTPAYKCFKEGHLAAAGAQKLRRQKKKKNHGSKRMPSESPNHLEMQTWGNEWDMLILPWKKHLWRRPVLPEKFRGVNVTFWNNAPTCFMRKKRHRKVTGTFFYGIKSLTRNTEIAWWEARKGSPGCPEAVLDWAFCPLFWGGLLFGLKFWA